MIKLAAKKLAFFSETSIMIKFLQNLALFRVTKCQFFAKFMGENISKIIASVPGSPWMGGGGLNVVKNGRKSRKHFSEGHTPASF
jgi:hypothetical protein